MVYSLIFRAARSEPLAVISMLDINFIRENPEKVKEGLKKKGVDIDIENLLKLDEARREKIKEVDDLRAKQNVISEEIARLQREERNIKINESKELKNLLQTAERERSQFEEEFTAEMYKLPNLPFEDVPAGKDETENIVLWEDGEKPVFSFTPKDYVTLGEELDLIDTKRAAKISGSRFGYLKHEAPLLEFALVQYIMKNLSDRVWVREACKFANNTKILNHQSIYYKDATHRILPEDKTFIPLVPPVMIKPEVFRAMGKLDPGQEEERYFIPKDNLYLVGSAEHSVGPLHMDETLDEEKLPHRHIAFSTSFRREAGSYGKDTKGILRVHQFDKLEMFSYVHPELSRVEHDLFLAIQVKLMRELRLPFQVMLICAGDMVWTDAKQYDINTWLPGQNGGKGEYRETHSTSNSTDFQARRLNAKFRNSDGKTHLLHTINGTAFAIGRTIIAILENYQQADGSVKIPEALQPFMHGIKEIRR
ncbi:MAG: serine--tRNA ligase [Candidatus Sungbacteria bacterium]|nr:serine--tRNA ligase [Candidatus Sungbacteria bacterium]